MDSGLIHKFEKAKRYAQEPERIRFADFTVRVRGNHRVHELSYHAGTWRCTCSFFPRHLSCSHSMAMEQILEGILPTPSAPCVRATA